MGTCLEDSQDLGAHALREEETLAEAVLRKEPVRHVG